MRLVAQLYVTVPSHVVRRDPSLLEKIKRSFGGKIDLDTDEVENRLEATAIVDAVRRALGRLGVGNALSLVIDDTVIFQDTDGKADDLPDLVLAMADHASVFGRGFKELRFAAEHEEAGLHLVIETRARTRHRRDDPAAVVSLGGRVRALEPRSGESAEAYRARVEPLTKDAALFETAKLSFESFASRLRDALRAVMPEATIDEREPEARLVKAPDRAPATTERPAQQPLQPGYDPFVHYYPSPMGVMLDAMLFASFMHMMMPPPIMVVSPLGMPIGHVSDVQSHPELASDHHVADVDHQAAHGGHGHDDGAGSDADHGGVEVSHDDGGGFDDGGGDFDDGGGGFDDGGGDWI
jgi:hypothetical protein